MAAKLDVEKMSLEDLRALAKEIEKAIKKSEGNNLKKARGAAEAAARQYGFSLLEIVGSRALNLKSEPSDAKYRNPDDPQQTWSGRGRQPQWFKEAIASGRAPSEMAA
jgi:DNA-binding protein H-NS